MTTSAENRYAYVQNNPTSMTDPSGLCGGGISFGFGFANDPWFGGSSFSAGDGEGGGGGGTSFGVGWGVNPW